MAALSDRKADPFDLTAFFRILSPSNLGHYQARPWMARRNLVLLVVTVLASLGWMGISLVADESDHARLAEVSLRHIEGLTHELNAIEETAEAENRYPAPEQRHYIETDRQMLEEISGLRNLLSAAGEQQRLSVAYIDYRKAEKDELGEFRRGQLIGGIEVADSRVDPAFEVLSGLIQKALRHSDQVAARANTLGNAGTAVILLAGVLVISVLFSQFAAAQRTAVLAETRLATHETVRQVNQRFEALAANASDVIAIVSPAGEIQYLTPNVRRLWGYAPELLLESVASSWAHPDDAGHLRAILLQAAGAEAGARMTTEVRLQKADGTACLAEIILTNLLSDPAVAGIVMTCRDVTERKAFEVQLAHQAFHDTLTGLPNRALFSERLRQALARSRRSQAAVGLLFVDLDNFKLVNDSLGHDAGDALLKAVALRLQTCVRPGDTVARLGGDEFTVLLEDLTDEEETAGVAERIIEVLQTPVTVAGREILVTGSLGSTVSRSDERTPDELLRDADTAMYQAKADGKAHCAAFDHSMNVRAAERRELLVDLHGALENNEFRVHYQPILRMDSGQLSEVEALVRWQHPTRGLIAPIEFIPLAEETGLILPLGRWVLEEACRQAKEWQDQHPQAPDLTVSVNLSARQLQQADLVDQVAEVLRATGLSAASLKLEITESVVMLDMERSLEKLHALKALGIRLAVDDFGTGYSSMSYLSNLPLDTLKIDRSFVSKIGGHAEGAAIVQAIVTLAKTLNLSITSEGIETAEQLSELRMLGCDQGQGYLLSRPLSKDAMDAFLEAGANPELRPAAMPVLDIARAA
jgi:diguanylate cyclase (GGDEF)-like protein/PAS domain S-box-containing protein